MQGSGYKVSIIMGAGAIMACGYAALLYAQEPIDVRNAIEIDLKHEFAHQGSNQVSKLDRHKEEIESLDTDLILYNVEYENFWRAQTVDLDTINNVMQRMRRIGNNDVGFKFQRLMEMH